MRGWMNDEKVMIACCSDGTRPVIFKIERMDYKALYINCVDLNEYRSEIEEALKQLDGVGEIAFRDEYVEVYMQKAVSDEALKETVEKCGKCSVVKID